jgi:hypothetical protein
VEVGKMREAYVHARVKTDDFDAGISRRISGL